MLRVDGGKEEMVRNYVVLRKHCGCQQFLQLEHAVVFNKRESLVGVVNMKGAGHHRVLQWKIKMGIIAHALGQSQCWIVTIQFWKNKSQFRYHKCLLDAGWWQVLDLKNTDARAGWLHFHFRMMCKMSKPLKSSAQKNCYFQCERNSWLQLTDLCSWFVFVDEALSLVRRGKVNTVNCTVCRYVFGHSASTCRVTNASLPAICRLRSQTTGDELVTYAAR